VDQHGFSTIREIVHGNLRLTTLFHHRDSLVEEWKTHIKSRYGKETE